MASITFVVGAVCFSGMSLAQQTSAPAPKAPAAPQAPKTPAPSTGQSPAAPKFPAPKTAAAPVVAPKFRMQTEGEFRYIASNGIPAFKVGNIRPHSYIFRMPLKPEQSSKATLVNNKVFYFGVAQNGVPIDSDHSAAKKADAYGGFFISAGQYAYKAIPTDLVTKDLSHVGYAADGFAIFVSKTGVFKPSYNEKKEFVAGSGNLDRCNGAIVNQKYYIYVITEDYPQVPLCWSGVADPSFGKSGAAIAGPSTKVPPAGTAMNPLPNVRMTQKAYIAKNKKKRGHDAYYKKGVKPTPKTGPQKTTAQKSADQKAKTSKAAKPLPKGTKK